jgi:hypothetical protein
LNWLFVDCWVRVVVKPLNAWESLALSILKCTEICKYMSTLIENPTEVIVLHIEAQQMLLFAGLKRKGNERLVIFSMIKFIHGFDGSVTYPHGLLMEVSWCMQSGHSRLTGDSQFPVAL